MAAALTLERDIPEAADFDAAVARYRLRVFRFALASLRDRDLAETVTQDTFLKAFRAWHDFRGDSSLQTWLMQIAVNLVRDAARSRRFQFWRRAETVDVRAASDWIPAGGLSPEQRASSRQQVEAVWTALATLPEKQRTAFLLRFMEEMELKEIEAAMGISLGAVKVHLFRAVHSVRKKVGKPQ